MIAAVILAIDSKVDPLNWKLIGWTIITVDQCGRTRVCHEPALVDKDISHEPLGAKTPQARWLLLATCGQLFAVRNFQSALNKTTLSMKAELGDQCLSRALVGTGAIRTTTVLRSKMRNS